MNDPLRRFLQQPWQLLAQVSGVTVAIALIGEVLLLLGSDFSAPFRDFLEVLLTGFLGMVLLLSAAFGLGVLAVEICERWPQQIYLNGGSVWALFLCLVLGVWLKSLLPVPQFLISASYPTFLGILIGVSWKSRRYWR